MKKNNLQKYSTADLSNIQSVFEDLLQHEELFGTGLCSWVTDLRFDYRFYGRATSKFDLAHSYIINNRPKSFLRTLKRCFIGGSAYFWPVGEIRPRIKFIKKHIKLIEKELEKRLINKLHSDETVIK